MMKKSYEIGGMHCDKCAAKVKAALEGVEGVHAARVDLEAGRAIVKMAEDVPDEQFVEAVATAGFTARPR